MIAQTTPVKTLVDAAVAAFEKAIEADCPLLSLAKGLDYLARAAGSANGMEPLSTDPLHAGLLASLVGPVAQASRQTIDPDAVAIALGAAQALQTAVPDEYFVDRLLHVAKLRADILAMSCARALAERGDPLTRAIAVRRLMTAPPHPGQSFH